MKVKQSTLVNTLLSVGSVVVFLGVWWFFTEGLNLVSHRTLPGPIRVFNTFIYKLSNKNPDGNTLIFHTLISLRTALIGYLMALFIGVPLGIVMAWYKPVDLFARPLFDLLKPIPGVAWVPLMIILLGIGVMSKATVIFISAIVPCVLNAYSGIKQTKDVHLWVARTFGASNLQMLFKIAIPTSLPFVVTGARVAIGASWVTIVAAELLASYAGLGFMIQQSRGLYRPDIIIVGMLTIGLCGAFLTFLLGLVEKRVVKGSRV
jgi:ABC-type nitrate/sulfonate/bicarbonate transport system permease component